MAYLVIYPKWLPYSQQEDTRGFLVRRFGSECSGVDSVCNAYAGAVCAVTEGTVLSVREDGELGKLVEYGTDRVRLLYCYLSETTVQPGDRVRFGDRLGIEGASGNAKSKHLRVMLWIDGCLTDPEPYLCGKQSFPVGEAVRIAQTPPPDLSERILTLTAELREIRARLDGLISRMESSDQT